MNAFRSPRLWVGLAVTAAWLLIMGQMFLRESGVGLGLRQIGLSPEELLVTWNDYEHWMWIEQNGRRLGAAQLEIRALPQRKDLPSGARPMPGYELRQRMRLVFRMLAVPVPIDVQMQVRMNSSFELETMQALFSLANQNYMLQAFTEPNNLFYQITSLSAEELAANQPPGLMTTDSLVVARSSSPLIPAGIFSNLIGLSGGAGAPAVNDASTSAAGLVNAGPEAAGRMPLEGPILLSDAVGPLIARTEDFEPGAAWTVQVADPLRGMGEMPLQVRVEDREQITLDDEQEFSAWRLSERLGDYASTVWYDHQGNVLRRDLPAGIRFLRANGGVVARQDPPFRRPYLFPEIDREAIKAAVTPELDGKALTDLLPALPQL